MEEIQHLKLEEADLIKQLPNSWRQKGKLEEKKNIARKMLKEGLPTELIATVTELDHAEIEKIRLSL